MASTDTEARLLEQKRLDAEVAAGRLAHAHQAESGAFVVACLVELPENEAYALAQLCKRITWSDCMTLSVDRAECQLQINATNRVREALARCGVVVR